MERANNGVRTAVEALVGCEGVGDEDNALGRAARGGHGDEFAGERALQGSEAEIAAVIVTEDEANYAVAEGADAIVEKNRAAFDLGALHFGHSGGLLDSYTV